MSNLTIKQLPQNSTVTSSDHFITQIDSSGATGRTTKTELENNLTLDNVSEGTTNKFMTQGERDKLSGVEASANNYVITADIDDNATHTDKTFSSNKISSDLAGKVGTNSAQLLQNSSETYTESNVTTSRVINADSVSLNELADVVGSLLADLRSRGVIA